MLAELARTHMITERKTEIFGLHDLLQAYASELARATDPASQRQAAVHRMLDHYLHTANAADLLLDPHRIPVDIRPPQPGVTVSVLSGPAHAVAWFLAEHPVLVSAVKLAAAYGLDRHAWQLAWAQADFLYWRGRWRDLATTHEVALAAARRAGSKPGQAHAHRGLAGAQTSRGRHGPAYRHLRQALALFADLRDHRGQAQIHRNLALVLTQQTRYRKALGQAQQAHGLCRAVGDVIGQARALDAIGEINTLCGDYQRALINFRRALTIQRQTQDRRGEADSLLSLGLAHHNLGDHRQAADCFRGALARFTVGDERSYVILTLLHLGDTLQASGEVPVAQRAWRQALDLIDELDDPNTEKLLSRLHLTDSTQAS
jgi:tetratricopeptide (TPR) repeat protein